MLDFYTPYIQFLAVIYSSMLFDRIISKFFWNKQFYDTLTSDMDKLAMLLNDEGAKKDEIQTAAQNQDSKYGKTVNTCAIIMLLITVMLLLLSGIQRQYNSDFRFLSCLKHLGLVTSIVITIPCVTLFFIGKFKTAYYRKIHNKIDGRLQNYSLLQGDIINKNTSNPKVAKMIADKSLNGKYEPAQLLNEVSNDLKKETIDDILKILS